MSTSPPPDGRARILDAALRLIARTGGADVSMGEIARAAGLSRQAVYLHFADRAGLFVALARHVDERRGLEAALRPVHEAPSGVAAIGEFVAMQARENPGLWAVARAFEAVRRRDADAERSWQDRLAHRLAGCRGLVDRLAAEDALRPGVDRDTAADLLWTMTSLRMWEDLVLERGWSAARYVRHVTAAILAAIAREGAAGVSPRRSTRRAGRSR